MDKDKPNSFIDPIEPLTLDEIPGYVNQTLQHVVSFNLYRCAQILIVQSLSEKEKKELWEHVLESLGAISIEERPLFDFSSLYDYQLEKYLQKTGKLDEFRELIQKLFTSLQIEGKN